MNIIKLELRFHPKEIYFPSDKNFQLIRKNHKIYYNIEDYEYKGKVYKSISYRLYYIYNGGIGCCHCFFPNEKKLGFHDIDREHIKILLNDDDKPEFVFFSAHAKEGKWVPWKDCKIHHDCLVVYVARASHANYPKSGIWWRIFGFANDLCSNKGLWMVPKLEKNEDLRVNPKNEEKCSTLKKRFFLPFFM